MRRMGWNAMMPASSPSLATGAMIMPDAEMDSLTCTAALVTRPYPNARAPGDRWRWLLPLFSASSHTRAMASRVMSVWSSRLNDDSDLVMWIDPR